MPTSFPSPKENKSLPKRKKEDIAPINRLKWGDYIDPGNPAKGKYFPLHEYQLPVYSSNKRYTAAIAGTGGGKTVCGAVWSVRQIQEAISKTGKCLGFIVAPTYKILSRATVPTFLETIAGTMLGISAGGRYLESKSYYELPNNWGKIWCQGADNPYGLEGGQFDFVWIDEGGQIAKRGFNALVGRTGQKQAPILVTTTPYITSEGFGPLHKEWLPRFKAGDSDYLVVQFPSVANPAYPMEEYERQRRLLPPEIFKSRYDGLFVAIEGQVYPSFPSCIQDIPSDELAEILNQEGQFYGGLDFGWNDPFCALSGFLHYTSDILYVWYERYRSQTILEMHADSLPKLPDRSICWYAEHNPEAIAKLRKGGHFVKRAPKFAKGSASSAIMNGILAVNARINSKKLIVIKQRCPALIAEAETYIYPEKNEEIIGDKPIDKDNHALDALRYMIMGIDIKKEA
jgi:phage terminase large subunit